MGVSRWLSVTPTLLFRSLSLANGISGAYPTGSPRPRRTYTSGRFPARLPSRSRTAGRVVGLRAATAGNKMNGTRNWCTLVDVHPEGQTAVRERGHAASPPTLGILGFQFRPSRAPRRGR